MARFYGDLTGKARTVATREGSEGSGVQGHLRGWGTGAKVSVGPHNAEGFDQDVVTVERTGGSNGKDRASFLAWWVSSNADVVDVIYAGTRFRFQLRPDGRPEVVRIVFDNGEEVVGPSSLA